MSKSRLEKFLYALYSLDSSDLPNPLSRIEELYKCLVTRDEAPTFKPLSRVEKYLMAILGVYDVDSLPNPLSRVEVLLYKLATGDDNLDDFKSFLSEHEELLAELIRNGGVGGDIDIEYVLYTLSTEFNTLYNTAEKPVKSAILKGNTLVNMVEKQNFVGGGDIYNLLFTLDVPVKLNTTYTAYISLNCADKIMTTKEGVFRIKKDSNAGEDLIDIIQFDHDDTTSSTELKVTIQNVNCKYFHIRSYNFKIENMILMLLESDHSSEDIPYFEGMQSVKMPVLTTVGKNLFDKNKSTSKYYIDSTGNYVTGGSGNFINQTHHINNNRSVSVSYSERIGAAYVRLAEFDKNNNFIRRTMVGDNGNLSFNLNTNTYYIVASVDYNNYYFTDLQIEFSPVATSYKPFKSNILTVNEEVELRGTDNVKDELDLTTGKLTQRTIQIPLNSDYFNFSRANNSDQTNTIRWQLTFKDDFIANSIKVGSNGKCNIIDYYKGGGADKECIFLHPSALPNRLQIKQLRTDTRFTTSEELELFLLKNQAYVVLELATESVKTVDLSVVDQDRNDTKLSTFNDITHVTISSEGLTPEAELEVATKNEEDLEDSIVYTTHILSEEFNTLYNTAKKPVKSAILKGSTKYHDIDTGDILDTFDATKNLEFVSVKMPVLTTTGKNLLNMDALTPAVGSTYGYIKFANDESKTYTLSLINKDESVDMSNIYLGFTKNGGDSSGGYYWANMKFPVISSKNVYFSFYPNNQTTLNKIKQRFDIQIEEGSTTTYEPYKSNILTVNEEVELRGIGNVQDELDLVTGELTERIGEVVIDETWGWYKNNENETTICYYSLSPEVNTPNIAVSPAVISNKLPVVDYRGETTGIATAKTQNRLYVVLPKGIEPKLYFADNPISVQYQLATESVKTVDLSVVDQDGNNTELKTFDDITHVTLSSEGLIPEAELEVAEKVPEVAVSMLTISREQEVIDTTTNEQSENVDVTMIATTEIYEGLL